MNFAGLVVVHHSKQLKTFLSFFFSNQKFYVLGFESFCFEVQRHRPTNLDEETLS